MRKAVKPQRISARAAFGFSALLFLSAGLVGQPAFSEDPAPLEEPSYEGSQERLTNAADGVEVSNAVKTKFLDDCIKRYRKNFEPIKTARLGLFYLKPSDHKKFCAKNYNDGRKVPNNEVTAAEIPKLKIGNREMKVGESLGACESTIEGVRISFETLTAERIDNCQKTANALEKFSACIANKDPAINCDPQLDSIAGEYEKADTRNKSAVDKVTKYVKKLPKFNTKAVTKFKADMELIKQHFAQNSTNPLEPSKVSRSLANNTLPKPENGGVDTIEEYIPRLGMSPPNVTLLSEVFESSLQKEQDHAKELADKFVAQLDAFNSTESTKFRTDMQEWRSLIGKRVTPDKSTIDSVAPLAAPAATVATQFMGNTTPAAAAAISGGSALPAALGVGGLALAGAAINNKAAAGSSLPSGQAPAAQVAQETAGLDSTNLLGEGGAVATKPLDVANNAAAAGAKTESFETAAAGANGIFSSSSASIKNGGKIRPDKKPNLAGPVAAPDEAAPGAFGGDLRPSPRPKKDDGMGEVSSLLGQMKNLFNFDEGAGMEGGGIPAPAPFPGASSRDPASDTYSSSGEEYGGSEEYAESDAPAEEEVVQGSGVMGANGSTLFKRVHERHRVCMEKGWVLSGLGGIPE